MSSIEKAGFIPGEQVALCLDIAATEFYKDSIYNLEGMKKKLSSSEMINYIEELCSKNLQK